MASAEEYLSFMRWEEIAIELWYGIDKAFRLHRNALDEICGSLCASTRQYAKETLIHAAFP